MLTVGKQPLMNSFYSSFWFPILAIVVRLNPYTAEISYFIIAGYALLGKKQVIQAFILCFFFTTMNREIIPITEFQSFNRYIVTLAAFFSIFLRTGFLKFDFLSLFTLGFAFFVIIHSIFFSLEIEISILKIVNWTVVIITLLKAWSGLSKSEHIRMQMWIKRFLLFIALSSLPFLLFSEIGYRINGKGFQGVLIHPQTFGMTIALLATIFFIQLFENKKSLWFSIVILFLLFWLIFLSESRTAFVSIIITMIIFHLYLCISIFFSKKYKFFFIFLFFYFLLIIIISTLFHFEIIQIYNHIISKSNRADSYDIFNSYIVSRNLTLVPMIENISKNFMTGIGFGVASDPFSMEVYYSSFFNLPISAFVEKTNLFIMIFEEIGIFGFILFVMWIFIIFYNSVMSNAPVNFLVLILILLMNMGEAVLFSPGGIGLLFLILLTSVITRPKLILNSSALKYQKN
jgi:O-antigen ligase